MSRIGLFSTARKKSPWYARRALRLIALQHGKRERRHFKPCERIRQNPTPTASPMIEDPLKTRLAALVPSRMFRKG